MIEKKDVKTQFSLLNNLYKDEVERLEHDLVKHQKECKGLDGGVGDEIKEMEEELKEKKLVIEKLEKMNQLMVQQEVATKK